MRDTSKNQDVDALFRAIGSAISKWNEIERRLELIFSSCLTMQLPGPDGGRSHHDPVPRAVLDAVDGFRAKLMMIDAALESCVYPIHDGASAILDGWAIERKKINSLHGNRNVLAHWQVFVRVESEVQRKRALLMPPFHSADSHEGFTQTDVEGWERAFIEAGERLGSKVILPLALHRPLQHKFLDITASQIRSVSRSDPSYLEYLKRELSGYL